MESTTRKKTTEFYSKNESESKEKTTTITWESKERIAAIKTQGRENVAVTKVLGQLCLAHMTMPDATAASSADLIRSLFAPLEAPAAPVFGAPAPEAPAYPALPPL